MKAIVYRGPRSVGRRARSRTRRSRRPSTRSSASRPRTSAAPTCTCTRAGPPWRRARSSATRTWGRRGGRPGGRAHQGRRPGLGALQHRLRHLPQLPGRRLDGFCLAHQPDRGHRRRRVRLRRRWARTTAGRPSTCACPSPTSTCSAAARQRARERLHHALGHLPDRLARRRAGGRRPRRPAWPSSAPDRSGSWRRTAPSSAARRGSSSSTRSPTGSRLADRDRRRAGRLRGRRPGRADHDATSGEGVDRGVEAVGYQAHDPTGEEHPELVMDNLVQVVRSAGAIGVVGVYVPEDPGAANEPRSRGASPSSTAPSSPRASAWAPARRP